jgi:hypothetical protein
LRAYLIHLPIYFLSAEYSIGVRVAVTFPFTSSRK